MRVPPATGFLVPPESGRVNALRMLAKVTESQSRGGLFIYERTLQPGAAVPLHVHASEDECSYILSGAVHYIVGQESFVATAGAYVVKPRGISHECANEGSTPARVIELAVPGSIEGFYRELAEIAGYAGGEQAARRTAVEQLSSRYGIRWAESVDPLSLRGQSL